MTQGVKTPGHLLHSGNCANNRAVTQLSTRKVFVLASLAMFALSASCKKKEGDKNSGTEAYKDIENTFDSSEPAPEQRKPVAGADTSKLEKHMAERFESLADKLPSPCGKAHSLRTSRNTDDGCKRAPFAVTYVFELVKDGATAGEVKELYKLRFDNKSEAKKFTYNSAMPHHGPTDAPVKLVEFFDYGCPACLGMKPVIEEALTGYETDVVIYYKQFPLSAHPDSAGAAAAALVAHKQGKFEAMHNLLFKNQHSHKMDDLKGYAGQIGLDLGNWAEDMAAVKEAVDADKAEGEKNGVSGTPALFINGRPYDGPSHPKYLKMWIDEQLAKAI